MNAATTQTNPTPSITCAFVDFTNSHEAITFARDTARHESNLVCLADSAVEKSKLRAWGVNPI
jgi:hypothetical protein